MRYYQALLCKINIYIEFYKQLFDNVNKLKNPFMILSVKDVSKDLHIGINQAYDLFRQNDFPTICIGKRKGITLATYLLWKMNKKGGI